MKTPKVSICIPTYNGHEFLEPCLESAVRQTYPDIEIIIVDDCSTDNTYDIIQRYAAEYSNIKIYRNQKNLGLVGNWNRCIELSSGEWIKFLLQDDYFEANCIEMMLAGVSEEDRIVACKRSFLLSDEVDAEKKKYYEQGVITFDSLGISGEDPVPIKPKEIAIMAAQNICMNFIGEPTSVMFKKEVTNNIGLFNADIAQICDLEYFLRIASVYGIRYVPFALAHFRIHEQSTTSLNLQGKLYALSHIDPIITVHQILYTRYYELFRSNLSFILKIKLKLYFRVRVYESFREAVKDSATLNKFETVSTQYPKISQYRNGSLFVRILYIIINLRRGLRNQ